MARAGQREGSQSIPESTWVLTSAETLTVKRNLLDGFQQVQTFLLLAS